MAELSINVEKSAEEVAKLALEATKTIGKVTESAKLLEK